MVKTLGVINISTPGRREYTLIGPNMQEVDDKIFKALQKNNL